MIIKQYKNILPANSPGGTMLMRYLTPPPSPLPSPTQTPLGRHLFLGTFMHFLETIKGQSCKIKVFLGKRLRKKLLGKDVL